MATFQIIRTSHSVPLLASQPSRHVSAMRVRVMVRDKLLDVQLGDGTQSLLWLANAALCRYDSSLGLELGPPLGLRLEDGTQLPLHCAVADYLADGAHVFVVLAKGQSMEM
jgi:hypothetical protein